MDAAIDHSQAFKDDQMKKAQEALRGDMDVDTCWTKLKGKLRIPLIKNTNEVRLRVLAILYTHGIPASTAEFVDAVVR